MLSYQSRMPASLPHEVCRRGFLLFACDGATFPGRCVRCNAVVEGEMKRRRFAWHDPMLFILLCAAPLIYFIVRPFIVKRARVTLGYCRRHEEQQVLHLAARVALLFGGCFLMVAGFAALVVFRVEGLYWVLFLAGFGTVVAAIFYPAMMQLVRRYRIEKGFLALQGVHRDFLNSLPDISPANVRGAAAAK